MLIKNLYSLLTLTTPAVVLICSNRQRMDENNLRTDGNMSREQSCFAQDEGSDTESEQTVTSSSSSSASSPMPIEDLGPVFNVKGIRATADSSVLTFRISRIDDPEIRDSWWEVTRSYEEFEAFNRLLVDCQKFGGMIYPPLPPPLTSKYEENFAEAPIIHRKQIERCFLFDFAILTTLSRLTKHIVPFSSRYLQMVALHSTLGRSQALADFLSPTYVIAEKTGRKGLFAKLAESFAGSSQPTKVPLRDIEEFFQNERDWSANYSIHLKTTLNAVLTVIHSEKSNRNLRRNWIMSLFPFCGFHSFFFFYN